MRRCEEKDVREFRDAFGLEGNSSVLSYESFAPSTTKEPFSSLGVLRFADLKRLDAIQTVCRNRRLELEWSIAQNEIAVAKRSVDGWDSCCMMSRPSDPYDR